MQGQMDKKRQTALWKYIIDRDGKQYVLTHADSGDILIAIVMCRLILSLQRRFFPVRRSHKKDIKREMEAVQHHRETVQPVKEKTGGSTFH